MRGKDDLLCWCDVFVVDDHGFGSRLRAGRLAGGLSQEQLAERSGLSVHAISELERGRTRWPHPGSVQRLADALGLTGQERSEFVSAAGRRLHRVAAAKRGSATSDVVPRQLPRAVTAFAGRVSELATLSRILTRPGGTVVVTAIGGTAGVGKTMLALRWGQLVADEFPDGQLYVNLNGFAPSGAPVPPGNAVRILLEGLGITAERLPHSEESQLDLYRSLLVGRRMLIVLDNARDDAQVRPLLPGSLTCRVVVTSRNQLASLEEAYPLLLDVLTRAEAWDLLEQRLGAEQLRADENATDQIITASAYLPLALSIVAARAALQPGLPLKLIAGELTNDQRLDAFTVGEPAADIRAVLSWSYRQLDDDTARTFRLAGLHPGPDLDQYAVAALTGMTLERARQALTALTDCGLIQRAKASRYAMHDLLREYARELVTTREPETEQRTALTALFNYYLHTAYAASAITFPSDSQRLPRVPTPAALLPSLPDHVRARQWLDSELANMVAISGFTAGNGWNTHAGEMSAILQTYLHIDHHYAEAVAVHRHALRAATAAGDQSAMGAAHFGLASAAFRQGRFTDAIDGYERALSCYEQAGDRYGQVRAGHFLSNAYQTQGRYRQVAAYLRIALAFYRETGDRAMEARALYDFGFLYLRLHRMKQATHYLREALEIYQETGDRRTQAHLLMMIGAGTIRIGHYRQAIDYLQEALVIMRDRGDRRGEAKALGFLGAATMLQGDYSQSLPYLETAIAMSREIQYRHGEADALADLGLAFLGQGRHEAALDSLRHALIVARSLQEPEVTATVLNSFGKVLAAVGEPAQSVDRHAEALKVAADSRTIFEKARAQAGLGSAHEALGDHAEAVRYWRLAYDGYLRMGVPEAEEIRRLLDS